jgi:hypothetical protein
LRGMKAQCRLSARAECLLAITAAASLVLVSATHGAGVTVITHGWGGNVTDWVIPMGDKIPQHQGFPGSNSASYQISITRNGSGVYSFSQTFLDGVSPLVSDSGEIVIALDWSSLSSTLGVSTRHIATNAALALLSTNLIPDLGGRPLAELPLHLVGHSRGGSVMAELARILGAQGVWVDHLTTLDPYPVNPLYGDPAMVNYGNVLFADDYWQSIDAPKGQALAGAYNRHLTALTNGGYPVGSAHSDTHLWYHGTVDLSTPTGDNSALITSAERPLWWTASEAGGTNSGFFYSLIGGGNRLSNLEPAGPGTGRIIDGFNQLWDLGAGVAANPATNRTRLTLNNGAWPNLIRLHLTGPSHVSVGDPVPLAFYYQYGATTSAVATVRLCLDPDSNPYNGNETLVFQSAAPGTGTSNVYYTALNVSMNPALVLPGTYSVFGRVGDAARARYLYAPQKLILEPSRQPPSLVAECFQTNRFQCAVVGWPGQTVILQASTNLEQWVSLQTNTLTGNALTFEDADSSLLPRRYYRAVLAQ